MARKTKLGISEAIPREEGRNAISLLMHRGPRYYGLSALHLAGGYALNRANRFIEDQTTGRYHNYVDSKVDAAAKYVSSTFKSYFTGNKRTSAPMPSKRKRSSKGSFGSKKARASSSLRSAPLRRGGLFKRRRPLGLRRVYNRRRLRPVRRRGGRKGNVRRRRAKLVSAISNPTTVTQMIADQFTCPASAVTGSKLQIPRVLMGFNAGDPFGRNDPSFLLLCMASLAGGPPTYITENWKIQHTITNPNNIPIKLTAYKVTVRNDLPNLVPYSTTIQTIITRGYDNAGITSPYGLNDSSLSIFKSPLFTTNFKVSKSTRHILQGGDQKTFVLKGTKPKSIDMHRFFNITASQAPSEAAKLQNFVKGETFWYFEASAFTGRGTVGHQIQFPTFQMDMVTKWEIDLKENVNNEQNIIQIAQQGFVIPDATTQFINPDTSAVVSYAAS